MNGKYSAVTLLFLDIYIYGYFFRMPELKKSGSTSYLMLCLY